MIELRIEGRGERMAVEGKRGGRRAVESRGQGKGGSASSSIIVFKFRGKYG